MAGTENIDTIGVGLRLDTTKFDAGLKAAKTSLSDFERARSASLSTPMSVSITPKFNVRQSDVRMLKADIAAQFSKMGARNEAITVPVKLGASDWAGMRQQISRRIGAVPIQVTLTQMNPVQSRAAASGLWTPQSGAQGGASLAPVLAWIAQSQGGSVADASRRIRQAAASKGITGREHGGPVVHNRPYLVGEKGPEIIVPRQPATVIPNHGIAPAYRGKGVAGYGYTYGAVKPMRIVGTGSEQQQAIPADPRYVYHGTSQMRREGFYQQDIRRGGVRPVSGDWHNPGGPNVSYWGTEPRVARGYGSYTLRTRRTPGMGGPYPRTDGQYLGDYEEMTSSRPVTGRNLEYWGEDERWHRFRRGRRREMGGRIGRSQAGPVSRNPRVFDTRPLHDGEARHDRHGGPSDQFSSKERNLFAAVLAGDPDMMNPAQQQRRADTSFYDHGYELRRILSLHAKLANSGLQMPAAPRGYSTNGLAHLARLIGGSYGQPTRGKLEVRSNDSMFDRMHDEIDDALRQANGNDALSPLGVFHATTNLPSVLASGLRTPSELRNLDSLTFGLGGGADYSSTTWSLARARQIAQSIRLLAQTARGEVGPDEITEFFESRWRRLQAQGAAMSDYGSPMSALGRSGYQGRSLGEMFQNAASYGREDLFKSFISADYGMFQSDVDDPSARGVFFIGDATDMGNAAKIDPKKIGIVQLAMRRPPASHRRVLSRLGQINFRGGTEDYEGTLGSGLIASEFESRIMPSLSSIVGTRSIDPLFRGGRAQAGPVKRGGLPRGIKIEFMGRNGIDTDKVFGNGYSVPYEGWRSTPDLDYRSWGELPSTNDIPNFARLDKPVIKRGQPGGFYAVAKDRSGNVIGVAPFETHLGEDRAVTLKPRLTWVDDKYRGKGIATAMYTKAERWSGGTMIPDTTQTDAGRALWKSPTRSWGKRRPHQRSRRERLIRSAHSAIDEIRDGGFFTPIRTHQRRSDFENADPERRIEKLLRGSHYSEYDDNPSYRDALWDRMRSYDYGEPIGSEDRLRWYEQSLAELREQDEPGMGRRRRSRGMGGGVRGASTGLFGTTKDFDTLLHPDHQDVILNAASRLVQRLPQMGDLLFHAEAPTDPRLDSAEAWQRQGNPSSLIPELQNRPHVTFNANRIRLADYDHDGVHRNMGAYNDFTVSPSLDATTIHEIMHAFQKRARGPHQPQMLQDGMGVYQMIMSNMAPFVRYPAASIMDALEQYRSVPGVSKKAAWNSPNTINYVLQRMLDENFAEIGVSAILRKLPWIENFTKPGDMLPGGTWLDEYLPEGKRQPSLKARMKALSERKVGTTGSPLLGILGKPGGIYDAMPRFDSKVRLVNGMDEIINYASKAMYGTGGPMRGAMAGRAVAGAKDLAAFPEDVMFENLVRASQQMGERDWRDGNIWYRLARLQAQHAARMEGYLDYAPAGTGRDPLRRALGAVAATSPQQKWAGNLAYAQAMMHQTVTGNEVPRKVIAALAKSYGLQASAPMGLYDINRRKALGILSGEGEITDYLSGPKVVPFFHNLDGNLNALTLDTIAAQVATSGYTTQAEAALHKIGKDMPGYAEAPSIGVFREGMASAYHRAHALFKDRAPTIGQYQAGLWGQWRGEAHAKSGGEPISDIWDRLAAAGIVLPPKRRGMGGMVQPAFLGISRIRTREELEEFVAQNPGLYSRWTPNIKRDMEPGRTSAAINDRSAKEIGISANTVPLNKYNDEGNGMLLSGKYDAGPSYRDWKYRRRGIQGLPGYKRRSLWLMNGQPVGSGFDGEPVLDPESIVPRAIVGRRAVQEVYDEEQRKFREEMDAIRSRQDAKAALGLPYAMGGRIRGANGGGLMKGAGFVPGLRALAQQYNREAGMPSLQRLKLHPLNPDFSRRTAAAYEALATDPDDESRAAYAQFAKETQDQYDFLTSRGFTFLPSIEDPYNPEPGDPRRKMEIAADDVIQNKRLFAFASALEHPLLSNDENLMFRQVHDMFGHLTEGFTIGPQGEYNAAIKHSQMYSALARKAMLAETHGQNSVVNFSETRLPGYGGKTIAEVNKARMGSIYADQKARVLPPEIMEEFYRLTGIGKRRRAFGGPAMAGSGGRMRRRDDGGLTPKRAFGKAFDPVADNIHLLDVADLYARVEPRLMRGWDDDDLAEIAASLKADGQMDPLDIREVDGQPIIWDGNHRIGAAMRHGITGLWGTVSRNKYGPSGDRRGAWWGTPFGKPEDLGLKRRDGGGWAEAIDRLMCAPSVKWGMEPEFGPESRSLMRSTGAPATADALATMIYRYQAEKQDALGVAAYDEDGVLSGMFSGLGTDGPFKMAVDEAKQRQGIGGRLLDAAYAAGFDIPGSIGNNRFTNPGRALLLSWLQQKAAKKRERGGWTDMLKMANSGLMGKAADQTYLVGELQPELFVPDRLRYIIPPDVMDKIPKRAEGGQVRKLGSGVMEVGTKGPHFFSPPEDGWIIPHNFVGRVAPQVPRAQEGAGPRAEKPRQRAARLRREEREQMISAAQENYVEARRMAMGATQGINRGFNLRGLLSAVFAEGPRQRAQRATAEYVEAQRELANYTKKQAVVIQQVTRKFQQYGADEGLARLTPRQRAVNDALTGYQRRVVAAQKEFGDSTGTRGKIDTGFSFLKANIQFAALQKGFELLMAQVGPTISRTLDSLGGFSANETRVTKSLGNTLRQTGGNMATTFGQMALDSGVSFETAQFLREDLGRSAVGKAAAMGQQERSDLFRASAAGGIPDGLIGSYGGLFGTGFFAEAGEGGRGYLQTIADDVIDFNAKAQPRVVKENGAFVTRPIDANQMEAGQARDALVADFNASADRGARSQGEDAFRMTKEVTAEQLAAFKAIGGEAEKLARAGFAIVDAAGNVVTTEERLAEATFQSALGTTIKDERAFAEASKTGLAGTFQINEAQRQFDLGIQRGMEGLQLLAQPLLAAGAGIVAPGMATGASAEVESRVLANLGVTDAKREEIKARFDTYVNDLVQTVGQNSPALKEKFSGLITNITGLGKQIAEGQTQIANLQAAEASRQFANNRRLAVRALQDAKGLAGQVGRGPDNLGALQRVQFQVQRELQSIGFMLEQRQINFSIAEAGFTAPGISAEERTGRIEEAKIAAQFRQKQLDLNKVLFGLSGEEFQMTAGRGVTDAQASLDLLQASRDTEVEIAEINQRIATQTQEMSQLQMEAQGIVNNAQQNFGAVLQTAGSYITQFGGALGSLTVQINKALGIETTTATGAVAVRNTISYSSDTAYTKSQYMGGRAAGYYGSVNTPTMFLAGEAGAETVMILRNPREGVIGGGMASAGTGSGIVVNINNPTVSSSADMETLERTITRAVSEALGREAQLRGLRRTVS